MADYLVTDTELTSIANAIRTKGGTSASLTFPTDYVSAINNISTGIVPTGTKNISISLSGTTTEDVTNYANAAITVPAGSAGTPTATKGTVSNHSINVTPSVTNTTGYISGGTKTGTSVSVSASELVSGTKSISISSSGTTTEDTTNYASVSITVPAYTGSHHSVTPAYTVQIALTNPINASYFSSCQVHEWLSSDITDVGNVIGSIENAAGSTAVTVDGIYGISIVINGMSVYISESGISCTGNVTYSGGDGMGALMFQVTGDGAITINGVDYDD